MVGSLCPATRILYELAGPFEGKQDASNYEKCLVRTNGVRFVSRESQIGRT
jgi:hypothetical protein